ncbi:MAG: hypothetical protein Q7S15_00430 [bacterium]|nr:hypothetical protein [bacterium]
MELPEDIKPEKVGATPDQAPPDGGEASVATEDSLKPLRTYKSDVAEAVKNKNASVVKIAMAEQERREKRGLIVAPLIPGEVSFWERHRYQIFVTLSILLIVSSVATSIFLFIANRFEKTEPARPINTGTPGAIMHFESERFVDTTDMTELTLRNHLESEKRRPLTLNTVANVALLTRDASLTPPRRPITSAEVLTLIKARASGAFSRSLEPNFMYGIHNWNRNTPFLVFKIASFDAAFSGMLGWEEFLYDDISEYLVDNPTLDTEAILESKKPYEDIVIKNKDVRALRLPSGEIALMYTFVDRETLVITTDESTLREVVDRVQSAKLIR